MSGERAETARPSGAAAEAEAAAIRARLEEAFGRIARERMAGLPMMNERLRVQAFGFERLGEWHVGVLLTPWFMSLMLLPAEDAERARGVLEPIGATRRIALPAGHVDCIVGGEEGVGRWLSCSLFSPVFEFADHEAAAETAQAALKMLLTSDSPESAESASAAGNMSKDDDAAALEAAFAGGFARVAAGAQRRRLRGEAAPGSEEARARRAEERERRAAEERARAEAARAEQQRRAAQEGVDARRRALLFGRVSER